MVESVLINTLLGSILGSIAGLIPGTGILISLMLAYPYLLNLDLISVLCFYIGLSNLAQFTGSITAIHFGVPGESNSIPSVIEGHALAKQGHGHSAIVGTSLASLCAGIITSILLIITAPLYVDIFQIFYQTKYQFMIISITLMIFLFLSKNKWYVTALLMTIGFIVGKIGFNEFTGSYFLSFNNIDLKTGIPLFPTIIGLLVIPNFFQQLVFQNKIIKFFKISDIKLFLKNFKFTLIGTIVGFVCGFIPGVSTVLATNLSHKISKNLDKNAHPSYPALISAEASNNSAILVTLLPLIILGIPITGSEAFLLSILDRNLIDINWTVIKTNNFQILLGMSVMISLLIGLLVSWPMSGILTQIIYKIKNYFKFFVLFLLLCSLIYVASITSQYLFYFICLLIASAFGLLFKKLDLLPLIFVFLLQEKIESVLVISYNIFI